MGDWPHWYLEIIVTKQEHQGRGARGMMMSWGVDTADEEGVKCYLDGILEGKSLYGKFGFRDEVPWPLLNETY